MKRWNCLAPSAMIIAAAGSMALAQMPPGSVRSMFSVFNSQVQIMTSDLVAVGTVEDAGSVQELDVTLPFADKPTRQHVQKFSLRLGRALRDTAVGAAAVSNTVVDVLQVMPPAITNAAGCPNQKGNAGVFLMKRLAGRTEMLVSRSRSLNEEANFSAIVAGVDGLSWGQSSNGLQMAVLSLGVAQASTNEGTLRVGVAVRNVSNGPIAVDRGQVEKRLAVIVDGKEAAMPGAPVTMAATLSTSALQIVTLQPNQVAMLSPRGNPDMGFIITLPPGEAWSVKARYEPTGAKKVGPPSWDGRLETGILEVKAVKPPARTPPHKIWQVPAPAAPDWKPPAEQKAPSQGAPRQAAPAAPAASQATPAAKQ